MKQIEVTIMGQSYVLACPEDGEELLRQAVSQVDREMIAIRRAGKVKARERIAVLAALNLAYQHAETAAAGDAAGAVSPAPGATEASGADPATLQALIARIDTALGAAGHLI
jgi:cell division protein ZapA